MRRFFGYYVKMLGKNDAAAIIFGITDKIAFIQVITKDESYYHEFQNTDVIIGKKHFEMQIGDNRVDKQGMKLNIHSDKLKVSGEIKFGDFTPHGKTRDCIMGPFRFLPFMECRHLIVSMRHTVDGEIRINDQLFEFKNTVGYIEGDKGKSFPRKYFWSQVHSGNIDISASAAIIPYLKLQFVGTICVIHFGDRKFLFATYRGAKIKVFESNLLVISQRGYELWIEVLDTTKSLPLKAPTHEGMTRVIHESIWRKVRYLFIKNGSTIFDITCNNAAVEFSDLNKD